MKVVKRDGTLEEFNKYKIRDAVEKAFNDVYGEFIDKEKDTKAKEKAREIANWIEKEYCDSEEVISIPVEDIQDMVEYKLMNSTWKDVAKSYIIYRDNRSKIREGKSELMSEVSELLKGDSDYWNNENSNKNPKVLSTQRDYMAGVLSTHFTRKFLLTQELVEAHDEGIIHFHDTDYFAQNAISNCCLIDLEDMLQNGTCINKIMIEKPHRLLTASTIATQIITAVTSSQFGGATITLTHLAPFVRDSYNFYLDKYRKRGHSEEDCVIYANEDLRKEIKDAVQTFNYQVNSMQTTNGQAPFLSVCMYLGETEEYKDELALLIQEFLKQRLLGLKNEVGVYTTPAFPKLLYMLEEDNIHEDSKYYYLTKLAAKCTAKRLVPDYISEKIMLQEKIDDNGNGNAYPCMG